MATKFESPLRFVHPARGKLQSPIRTLVRIDEEDESDLSDCEDPKSQGHRLDEERKSNLSDCKDPKFQSQSSEIDNSRCQSSKIDEMPDSPLLPSKLAPKKVVKICLKQDVRETHL
jgi:hypothetical protein